MKSLKSLVAIAFACALICPGLYAQTDMRVNIPFDFHAGRTFMPAGDYRIHEEGSWIVLSAEDGQKQVGLMTNSAVSRVTSRLNRVVFHRYGSAYFLTTVWNAYSGLGRDVPPTSVEKELARKGSSPLRATIVAANRQ